MKDKAASPTKPAGFDVVIDDERWIKALGDAHALAASCIAAAAALEPGVKGAAALLLADDAALQDLNRRFRDKDEPTNVLSFPAGEGAEGFLGDIAIAFETCRREAEEQGIAFRDHAAHLIVHGLLHLVGWDHEADDEADRMERLETRILATLGVDDPYRADAARP
ncbi:MAG: rRNA maturation RNase YbeY [Pseudomonadota bacterium]